MATTDSTSSHTLTQETVQITQADVIAEALRLGFRWEHGAGGGMYLTNETPETREMPTHHMARCAACGVLFAVTRNAWNLRTWKYGTASKHDPWYCSKVCTGAAVAGRAGV